MNVMSGSYTLTITDANGCSVIEVYGVAEPSLLVTTVSASQTYILNASVVGGTPPYSYSWQEQLQPGISLGSLDSYTVGSYGTYYVVVMDANGCESESNSTTYDEGSLGTIGLDANFDLHIYPNPFREEMMVDFGRKVSHAIIKVVDVCGQLIETHELKDTDSYIIKRTNKASGVYLSLIHI